MVTKSTHVPSLLDLGFLLDIFVSIEMAQQNKVSNIETDQNYLFHIFDPQTIYFCKWTDCFFLTCVYTLVLPLIFYVNENLAPTNYFLLKN